MHVLKPKPEFRHQPLQAIQIVLWLSVLTEHQVHTFRALQDLLGLPIHFVVGLRTLADRTTQGWCEPEVGDLSVETLPCNSHLWWILGGPTFLPPIAFGTKTQHLHRAHDGIFCGVGPELLSRSAWTH